MKTSTKRNLLKGFITLVVFGLFADLTQYLKENLSVWSGLPSIPFTPVILAVTPRVLDVQPEKVSPISVMERVKAPVLLIHGTGDTKIPAANSQKLFRAASTGNSIWLVKGADHVGSYRQSPKEYVEHILNWFKKIK